MMKIAPFTRLKTSSWGERMYLRTVRMATTFTVAPMPALRLAGVN
jgi:hypothetical protein